MSGPRLVLGIDQGTHATRAIVFDADLRPVARAAAPLALHVDHGGVVEQDADAVAASVGRVLDAVGAALGPDARRLDAAGLAVQRSSVVAWDRVDGRALTPVLSWQDRRAGLGAGATAPGLVAAVTGLRPTAHAGAPKLRWLLEHDPAVRAAARAGRLAWGPLAAWLVVRCTRERRAAADAVNAARTQLLDLDRRDWAPALLALHDLPRAALPAVRPCRFDFGTVGVGSAEVPLTVCTGDQPAALLAEAPRPDVLHVNVGTGAFIQRLETDAAAPTGGLLRSLAWCDDDTMLVVREGTVNGAGAAVAAIAAEADLAPDDAARRGGRRLAADGPRPLYVNAVGGVGSPFWRSDLASRFEGDGDLDGRLAAVLESIVLLLEINRRRLDDGTARCVALTGGLARVDGFAQCLADATGLAVERGDDPEATARGAARLAGGLAPAPCRTVDRFDPRPGPALAERGAMLREALETGE